VSEDGRYAAFCPRPHVGLNELYLQRLDSAGPMRPVTADVAATYSGAIVDSLLLIMTDAGAPMGMVYVTNLDRLARQDWRVFAPEQHDARLSMSSRSAAAST